MTEITQPSSPTDPTNTPQPISEPQTEPVTETPPPPITPPTPTEPPTEVPAEIPIETPPPLTQAPTETPTQTPNTPPPPSSEEPPQEKPKKTSSSRLMRLLDRAREALDFRMRARHLKIMDYAHKNGSITNDQVEKLLRVSDSTAGRYLGTLTKNGKLRKEKGGRSTVYRP